MGRERDRPVPLSGGRRTKHLVIVLSFDSIECPFYYLDFWESAKRQVPQRCSCVDCPDQALASSGSVSVLLLLILLASPALFCRFPYISRLFQMHVGLTVSLLLSTVLIAVIPGFGMLYVLHSFLPEDPHTFFSIFTYIIQVFFLFSLFFFLFAYSRP